MTRGLSRRRSLLTLGAVCAAPMIVRSNGHAQTRLPDQALRILVGFAAETNDVAANARKKLASKGADLIVANDVTQKGAGFDVETNIVSIFTRDGREISLPQLPKFDVANRVFDEVLQLRQLSRSDSTVPRQR